MTMHAITLRQPWAHAVAHFGKDVENRQRRPPAHLIGQRVAIHVGKTWGVNLYGIPLPSETVQFARDHCRIEEGRILAPPNSGRIVATARLVGWVLKLPDGLDCGGETGWTVGDALDALRSPWFTGPIGWTLADVRPLAVPVGQECDECGGDGCRDIDDGGNGRACCCNGSGQMAIRGQVYPFALTADVEAAILRQEGKC